MDKCPRLEGTYSNHAVEVFPSKLGELKSLSDTFALMSSAGRDMGSASGHARNWNVPSDAVKVSITQSPETLKINFIDENKNHTSLNFRRFHFSPFETRFDDLFECNNVNKEPRLRFFVDLPPFEQILPNYLFVPSLLNLYVGGSATIVFFLKATDGSLIVQWRKESIGISGVIIGTHYSLDSIWWRYPLLKDVQ